MNTLRIELENERCEERSKHIPHVAISIQALSSPVLIDCIGNVESFPRRILSERNALILHPLIKFTALKRLGGQEIQTQVGCHVRRLFARFQWLYFEGLNAVY